MTQEDNARLKRIERLVVSLIGDVASLSAREDESMALGQEILDAVNALNALVENLITVVNGLLASNSIDPAVAAQIKQAVADEAAKVQAEINQISPPPPPAQG